MSRKGVKSPYQFLYIDFIGPITPMKFGAKKHFFIFTDDNIHITEPYIGRRKSK